jgi:hypothetical protein
MSAVRVNGLEISCLRGCLRSALRFLHSFVMLSVLGGGEVKTVFL